MPNDIDLDASWPFGLPPNWFIQPVDSKGRRQKSRRHMNKTLSLRQIAEQLIFSTDDVLPISPALSKAPAAWRIQLHDALRSLACLPLIEGKPKRSLAVCIQHRGLAPAKSRTIAGCSLPLDTRKLAHIDPRLLLSAALNKPGAVQEINKSCRHPSPENDLTFRLASFDIPENCTDLPTWHRSLKPLPCCSGWFGGLNPALDALGALEAAEQCHTKGPEQSWRLQPQNTYTMTISPDFEKGRVRIRFNNSTHDNMFFGDIKSHWYIVSIQRTLRNLAVNEELVSIGHDSHGTHFATIPWGALVSIIADAGFSAATPERLIEAAMKISIEPGFANLLTHLRDLDTPAVFGMTHRDERAFRAALVARVKDIAFS
jgi:hypothetical protein